MEAEEEARPPLLLPLPPVFLLLPLLFASLLLLLLLLLSLPSEAPLPEGAGGALRPGAVIFFLSFFFFIVRKKSGVSGQKTKKTRKRNDSHPQFLLVRKNAGHKRKERTHPGHVHRAHEDPEDDAEACAHHAGEHSPHAAVVHGLLLRHLLRRRQLELGVGLLGPAGRGPGGARRRGFCRWWGRRGGRG